MSSGMNDPDHLLRQMAKDISFIRHRQWKKYKLLLIPLVLMLLFGLFTFVLEIASYVNGVGPHR
jgi:hypothetical protein